MKEDKSKPEGQCDIRKQSEEVLKGKTIDIKKLSSGDAQKLVHELEVHQVELEMQNEELRKVQNVLEETRNRYSDLYDFAPVGYFTFDKDGVILEVNLTGAKKIGRERSYLIKKPFSLYVAPDFKGTFYSHLQEVFDIGTQTTCELALVDKKGHKFDVMLESMPARDSIGNLLVRTAMSDITQRKLAEDALKKNESSLKKAQELGKIGNWELDLKTQKINWSDEVYVLYERDKNLGPPTVEEEAKYYTPEIAEKLHEFARLATETSQEYIYDFAIRLPNGRNAFFNSSIIPVKDEIGNVIQLWGTVQDITERKRAENASQEARLYAESILDTVREPFVVLDKELKVISASRSFYSTFEVTADETVGKLIYNIGNRQWDIPLLRTLLEEILPKETQFNDYEVSHKFQTIGQKIMLLNARQIHQEVIGAPIILLAIEDITQRKRIEEELKKHREHLEELVNERTREMRLAKDEALRASAVKTDLLMKMSHELRTPLNAILGFSSLLNMKDVGELNEKQQQYITTISKSGKHLLGIITDMLDLAKVQAGEKLPLSIESFPAQRAIDDTLIFVNEKATQNNIIIKKEIDPEIDIIRADKIRFKQILLKLLDNAIKFSKPGGGTILITARKAGDMAQFSVSDTGIGIIQENIGKIFGMFYQEESGICRKYEGTGVGLAIIKQLVEQHGGKLWVESTYGIGSTFTFSIPFEAKKGK